jgi:putative CocE/NonD family hydrolase
VQCVGVLGLALGPVLAGAAGFGQYQPEVLYRDRVTHSEYHAMRDGVRLAIRVSRPAIAGVAVTQRLPVIWQHALTITEDKGASTAAPTAGYRDVPALTDFGYVVVQVARRGNGQSFGSRRGYNDRTEADDAYELTEWLAAQPWSNGRVGIYGCSNTGDAAMQSLTTRPPHLQAAFAGCFSWSKFDAFHRGGIFAQWGTGPQRTIAEDTAIEPVDGDESKVLLSAAAAEHQLSTNLFELWKSMPYRDSWSPLVASRFWYEGSISSFAERLRESGVAIYIQGGWHDELRDQGLIALLNLPNSRILIGPWKHCQNPDFALLQEIHRFFDTYLKDVETGLRTEPRIHYYTMGSASADPWHTAAGWPLADARAVRWYLRGAGLEPHAPRGAASTKPVGREFTVHTKVTCPDAGQGPFAQPCHDAGEGMSYPTAPLTRDVAVTGSPVISLRVSSQRSDATVFVYLEDVAPDGSIQMVTEGRLRASLRSLQTAPWDVPGTPWHRSWAADAETLTPAVPVTLELDLMPTSYVFHAGHRLQITITGADYRQRNLDADADGNRVTVLSEAAAPSYVDLPVIEPAAD